MRIGMVTPYDWSYPGGVRNHIRQLAEQFIKMGHEVRIIAPASKTQDKILDEYVYTLGSTIPFPINGSLARVALEPVLVPRMRRILQNEQFDILHVHEPLVPVLPLAALHFSHTVTIGTFHAFASSSITSTPYLAYASASSLLRPYFRRLSGRIAVSNAAERFVSHYFPADYQIIPNGVNLERFHPSVVPLPHLMDEKWNILFVGRFEKRKGAQYLLRAIPLIREQYPRTRFLFVGEGRLRRKLQREVEQQGWRDVVFTGYVSDEDLPRYFASSHVFCSPATGGESMGIVLLEAMASGTPIVATNIAGYATVVNSGVDGLLFPPCNSQELARAVGNLLENGLLRQQLIHDWSQIAGRVLDYYYACSQTPAWSSSLPLTYHLSSD